MRFTLDVIRKQGQFYDLGILLNLIGGQIGIG